MSSFTASSRGGGSGGSPASSPVYGKLLAHFANGGTMDLQVFRSAGTWLLGGIVLAMVLAMFMRETGPRGGANA